jgi:GxxExxY protein
MTENEIAKMVVDKSIHIHKALGPGLLESVYQRILAYELRKAGLEVETESPVPVEWDGHVIDESFRADMVINSKVLLELKSVEQSLAVHRKQTLTYLKLTNIKLGLLINFGAELLKNDLHRIVNKLPEQVS